MTSKRPKGRTTDSGKRGERGARGPRGTRGARGAQGPPGTRAANGEAIARLASELIDAQNALQVQFKRIAQLQAELDELRAAMRKPTTL